MTILKRTANVLALCIVTLALTACTSSEMLKSHVGGTIGDAVLDMGPPTTFFDRNNGTRAFIWQRDRSITTPGTLQTRTNANVFGTYNSATLYGSQSTNFTPPRQHEYSCYLVLFAKKEGKGDSPDDWRVVDFKNTKELVC